MRFLDLKTELKNFIVFSINDILKIDPNFHRQRLSEWQEKGYIKKLVKEYYIFSDQEINESILFIIANEIYDPSYVSLESAFSYYNLIPEGVYTITSVSSRSTCKYDTEVGFFEYHKIRSELMFGYVLKYGYNNHRFKIADKEKAILDYLYINTGVESIADFEEMRFNIEELKNGFDVKKAEKYLTLFDNKELKKRFNSLKEYIYHA